MTLNNTTQLSLTAILVLILAFAASFFSLQVPSVQDDRSNQSSVSFSATKAIERLAKILPTGSQPHPVNSLANKVFRTNIINQLSSLGLSAEVQTAMSCDPSQRALTCSKINNIITEIPGTDSSQTVLLVAHYDSVPAGSGAADAGHAVAIILEILQLMNEQAPFKNDLIVLINEGEEYGLLGAEAFMKEHPLAKTVDVVINMEARGNQGKSLLFETGEDNFRLMKLYQEYAKNPLGNSITYEIYKLLPNDTDLTVFKRNGITGVNFAFQGHVSHYHTPADNIQNLSPGSVQHQGDNAYAMLKALLSVDLKSMPEGNAVYTDVLSSFMIIWPEYMTVPLTFFALFLLILISWQLLTMKKITVNQMTLALPFAFGVILLSTISCWLLINTVQYLTAQPQPWLTEPIPMRAAIWILPFAVSLIFANKYKDKLSFWGLVLAGAYLLAVISIAASFNMPGLSYLTIIPLLLLTIMLSLTIISNQISNSSIVSGVLLMSTATIAVLAFPIMLLLEDAMGFAVAPVFGFLESLVILFVIPLIIYANSIVKRQIVYGALIVSFLGVFITSQQQEFSKKHPMALNFEYLQQANKASIQALTRHKLPQKMIAESEFSNEKKTIRPWSKATYPSIETASLTLAEPMLEIISSTQNEGEQQLSLRYSSERHTDQFLIFSKDTNRIKSISFDQHSFDVPSNQDSQYILCTGVDCNGMIFTLSVSGEQPLELELVDYSFGLPEALGYLNQSRGETAQQIQTGDVALVHKSFELTTK